MDWTTGRRIEYLVAECITVEKLHPSLQWFIVSASRGNGRNARANPLPLVWENKLCPKVRWGNALGMFMAPRYPTSSRPVGEDQQNESATKLGICPELLEWIAGSICKNENYFHPNQLILKIWFIWDKAKSSTYKIFEPLEEKKKLYTHTHTLLGHFPFYTFGKYSKNTGIQLRRRVGKKAKYRDKYIHICKYTYRKTRYTTTQWSMHSDSMDTIKKLEI